MGLLDRLKPESRLRARLRSEMEQERFRAYRERQERFPSRTIEPFDFGPAFPLAPGRYVHMMGNDTNGGAFSVPVWFLDGPAIERLHDECSRLVRSLSLVGADDAARMLIDFSDIEPVTSPDQDIPDNYAVVSMLPPTPTGRRPKYAANISFDSSPFDWDIFDHPSGYTGTKPGCRGELEYLHDGSIGKAFVSIWQGTEYYSAWFKLGTCELQVSRVNYMPYNGDQRTIYRLD